MVARTRSSLPRFRPGPRGPRRMATPAGPQSFLLRLLGLQTRAAAGIRRMLDQRRGGRY